MSYPIKTGSFDAIFLFMQEVPKRTIEKCCVECDSVESICSNFNYS